MSKIFSNTLGIVLVIGALLIGSVGVYFSYPLYVQKRITDEIAAFNAANENSVVTFANLAVDPWTSTLTATRAAIEEPLYSASMADVSVKTDSFLFLTPVETVTIIAKGEILAREKKTETDIAYSHGDITGLLLPSLLQGTAGPEPLTPVQALTSFNFKSITLYNGTVSSAGRQQGNFERIAVTNLRDGIVGEFLVEGLEVGEDGREASFGKIALRNFQLIDLDGFDHDADAIWVPVSSDDPHGRVLELAELEMTDTIVEPNDGKTDKVSVDRLLITDLTYEPDSRRGEDEPSTLRALAISAVEVGGISVASKDGVDVGIGHYSVSGFADGVLARLALGDLTVNAEDSKAEMGSFSIEDVNLAAIVDVTQRGKRPGAAKPSPIEIASAFAFGGFDMTELAFDAGDGGVSKVGKISLGNLEYFNGLPVAAKMSVVDNYQAIAKETIEKELEGLIGPVSLDFPTETLTSTEMLYRMDVESGILTIDSLSSDSIHGMRSVFDLRLSGLKPVVTAIANDQPDPAQHVPEIALEKIKFEIDSGEEWPVPEAQGGKQSLRLFLMQMLVQNAPPDASIVVNPALRFLERGGRFQISLEPPLPFPVLQMQVLPMLPPQQAVQAIGLTAAHE